MLNTKQEHIRSASGRGRMIQVALCLALFLMLSGAVTVQAQKMPFSFAAGDWPQVVGPRDHTPFYLPSNDGDRYRDWLYSGPFPRPHRSRYSHPYDPGYWYHWTFYWGRYDVPNDRWWSFGEGYFDERGNGGTWTASEPPLTANRIAQARKAVERRSPEAPVVKNPPRVTRRSGISSSGISASGGSSFGGSGGGSSGGSSRGGKK